MAQVSGGNRRIDHVLSEGFAGGLEDLSVTELRERRDLARGELEYQSLLRRLIQGRRDILKAERERRIEGKPPGSLIEQLSTILADAPSGPGRGGVISVAIPEEELSMARRRVERLVSDATLSNATELPDEDLEEALVALGEEEGQISETRSSVIQVFDRLQDELKRRYKEDLSQVL